MGFSGVVDQRLMGAMLCIAEAAFEEYAFGRKPNRFASQAIFQTFSCLADLAQKNQAARLRLDLEAPETPPGAMFKFHTDGNAFLVRMTFQPSEEGRARLSEDVARLQGDVRRLAEVTGFLPLCKAEPDEGEGALFHVIAGGSAGSPPNGLYPFRPLDLA